jgi:Mg2+ and Co2+ transporter CorA
MGDGKTDMMNKTLYTLTLITAIATPLMLTTGLFGMNFDDMSELVLS